MKLGELRSLVSKHDDKWYVGKLLFGEYDNASQIKDFLQQFASRFPDYELQSSHLLSLARLLPTHSELSLVKDIAGKFLDAKLFFPVFAFLDAAKLIDETNFPKIYAQSYDRLSLLNKLFLEEKIPRKRNVLELVIALHQQYFANDFIYQFLALLNSRNLLADDRVVKLILDKKEDVYSLLRVSNYLVPQKMLDHKSLSFIAETKNFSGLIDCLKFLEAAKIHLDYKLLKSLCSNELLYLIADMAEFLSAPPYQFLDKNLLQKLLTKDFKFFFEKTPIIKTLIANDLFDKKIFEKIFNHTNIAFIQQCIAMVAAKNLLQKNKHILLALLNGEVDEFQFYKIINYAYGLNFLDDQRLNFIFQLAKTNPTSNIFNLFDKLDTAKFKISKPHFEKIFSLTENNLKRLAQLISGLIEIKQLNHNTLENAIDRVTLRLPQVRQSSIMKISRQSNGRQRSQITLDNNFKFFMEHKRTKNYDGGSFGKVKKGFAALDDKSPIVSLKKLAETDLVKSKKAAIRETKYHRLLQRQSFYFSDKNRSTIVTTWLNKKSMERFPEHEIKKTSLAKRLDCLISALTDLNILHVNFRIHGDVKLRNFILDLQNAKLRLIDFGTAHKILSRKGFSFTPAYCDGSEQGLLNRSFCDDMWAMGIITAYLFPELFAVNFNQAPVVSKLNHTALSPAEQSIIVLFDSMRHPERKSRCTSEAALNYCQQIKNKFVELDESTIRKISDDTIKHAHTSVEDVFRGRRSFSR